MDKLKQKTEVTILGQKYALKSEFDQEFVGQTAALVNEQMKEISDRSATVSSLKVAVLTAMNIAGEYLKEKQENSRLKGEVKDRTGKLINIIDSQLK